MSYDRRTRTAHWVFEHLTRESVKRNEAVDRTKSAFSEDNSIHKYFRSQVCIKMAGQEADPPVLLTFSEFHGQCIVPILADLHRHPVQHIESWKS